MTARAPRPLIRARQAGFTLVELVVTLFVLSIVLVGALALFDFNTRVSRAQLQLAEMQQSLRIAQYDIVRSARMAGRGGLPVRSAPAKLMPSGIAVDVRNNVVAGEQIGKTAGAGPVVLAGTDVLTIRGVFSTPAYQVNFADNLTFTLGDPPSGGKVILRNISPTGVPQDLTPLIDAVTDKVPEALLLVSPLDDSIYAVVELVTGAPTDVSDPTQITLAFKFDAGTRTTAYQQISAGGGFPARLNSVALVGILEEHRFYIRQEFAVAGVPTSDLTPKLSRVRVFPNSDVPYRGAPGNLADWQIDIADNMIDLQVAIGLDSNGDGVIFDDGTQGDEWLFNHPLDDPAETRWDTIPLSAPPVSTPLFYLRLTTVARTDRRDPGYEAPLINTIEDHSYAAAPSSRLNTRTERMFRRRALETLIDMRNLG